MYLGYQNGRIITYTKTIPDKDIYNLEKIEETDDEYVYIENDDCMGGDFYKMTPEIEGILKQKERERKDRLLLTPSDVERALYKAMSIDFNDLKKIIADKMPQLDLKSLEIEFKASKFYRGATWNGIRLFDVVGEMLGYTPDDMDYLFENKELPAKALDADADSAEDLNPSAVIKKDLEKE